MWRLKEIKGELCAVWRTSKVEVISFGPDMNEG